MSTPIDLTKCPECGGEADNGHDRCLPPNVYYCTKCVDSTLPTKIILEPGTEKEEVVFADKVNQNEYKPDLVQTKYMTIEEVNKQYPLRNLSTKALPKNDEPPGLIVIHGQDDDWAYDEAKDNELQDRLAAQEPINNPVY